MSGAFVVESPIVDNTGAPGGVARVYVGTEARAHEIASAHPARTYRAVALADMPQAARDNLERARAAK